MGSGAELPGKPTVTPAGTWVRDAVRDVVAEVAPEELPLVEGLAGFDDAVVVRRLAGRGRQRGPLGFGFGEVAALVTPVVWLAVDQAARRSTNGSVMGGVAEGAKAALRRVFRRRAAAQVIGQVLRILAANAGLDPQRVSGLSLWASNRLEDALMDASATRLGAR